MGITKVNFSEVFNNKIKILFQNESIKITEQDLAIPNQTHSSNVQFVTKPGIYDNTDGLVTSKEYNLKLSTKVADCVPIYLFDSKNNFYGLIHSGWKGTKNHIILNALEIFKKKGSSNFKNIQVFIGPHIRSCCYEVGWDVAKYFSFFSKDKKLKKWFLSLEKEIIFDCISKGILNENIIVSKICTYDNKQCESFRRDGHKSKRMIGVIG